jgi:hypothetical protein
MLPKINAVCSDDELRPAMNYIQIDSNRIVATNGMILVWLPTNNVFGEEITSQLSENPIYIYRKDWDKFTKPYRIISFVDGNFHIQRKDGSKDIVEPRNLEERFPVYDSIIPEYNVTEVSPVIGFDPRLAVKVLEAMSYPKETHVGLNICISGKNKVMLAWVVKDSYNNVYHHELQGRAVIMQYQCNDGSELF